jgi:hypothetical protein
LRSEMIISGLRTSVSLIEPFISVVEMMISESEMIIYATDTGFLEADIALSDSEKTVGTLGPLIRASYLDRSVCA